ncbi:MAG TPA: NAD(P)-binding domain-containing protein [Burkholderiaceae bacterium]|nr:NAD(P)-binding domain-containing protein [Burkholderiaceae bacterium]
MKIAILGTGTVGQTLAKGFLARGHDVMIGSRDAAGDSARRALANVGSAVRIGTFAQAAAHGDLAVLATAWSGTQSALELAGAERLAGKVVADATNPLAVDANGPRLALGFTTSAGEQVQDWLPGSLVVKVWNTVGAGRMVDPTFPEGRPTMFVAGNDAGAKRTIFGLLDAFGWDGVDIGNIEGARLLEPMAMLWITYAKRNNHWTAAFKLLGAKAGGN